MIIIIQISIRLILFFVLYFSSLFLQVESENRDCLPLISVPNWHMG